MTTMAHDVRSQPAVRGAVDFVPALEGLRAVAAVAVLTTHVAFQTGNDAGSTLGRSLGRLDLSVAVFFALSGFLLWRPVAEECRLINGLGPRSPSDYYRSRLARVLPAYLVLAVTALVIMPENSQAGFETWFANLTLTQVYIPHTLTSGLTHAWSLAVEIAFYLTLPLMWLAMSRLRGSRAKWRIPVIAAVAAASATTGVLPLENWGVLPADVNEQTLPLALAPWFAAGMILAEMVSSRGSLLRLIFARRAVSWTLAGAAFALSTIPEVIPAGFVYIPENNFAAKVLLGTIVAWGILAPIVLGDTRQRFPILESSVLQIFGRWSYGMFLWHVLILAFAFDVTFTPMFDGHFWTIWFTTLIGSTAFAAVSFAWVEHPCRQWGARRRVPAKSARAVQAAADTSVPPRS